jgi:hypothetical protein
MTLHYHGLPITPNTALFELAGRMFCVSYANPGQVSAAHNIGQSVMLDNGAFSFWKKHTPTDWPGYYDWCDEWLDCPTTWSVIPDVIDGTIEENDRLIRQWPHGDRGAPVWHMNEPIDRLIKLADEHRLVCFGSAGEYSTVGDEKWHIKCEEAFNALCHHHTRTKPVHMLRGLSLAGSHYPFYSMDSTNVARNHKGSSRVMPKCPKQMVSTIDSRQCSVRWFDRETQKVINFVNEASKCAAEFRRKL